MAKSFSSRASRRELPPTAGSTTVSALGGRAGASVGQSTNARSDKTSPRRLTAGVLMASEDISMFDPRAGRRPPQERVEEGQNALLVLGAGMEVEVDVRGARHEPEFLRGTGRFEQTS